MMVRTLGVVAYAAFNVVFVYFIAFCMGLGVPRTVDSAGDGGPIVALVVDLALVAFFGVAHSVMARPWFKRAFVRVVPAAAERSVYVLVASLQLALLCWQWRSPGGVVWRVTGGAAALLVATSAAGWALAFASSFAFDQFELFGIRQAFGRAAPEPVFRVP